MPDNNPRLTDLEHNVLVALIDAYGAEAVIERINDIVADRNEEGEDDV